VWTPEELEQEKIKLNDKILAIRKKKKEEEAQRDLEREISRRQNGKSSQEAQKLWEENKVKREEFLKKKEKEEERTARKAIQEKIEADKRERARKLGKPTETPVETTPPPTETLVTPKKDYNQTVIQIRLQDGNTIKASFLPTDPIRTVHTHISLLLNHENFSLMTTFPKKIYSPRDVVMDSMTLKQAELVPSGTFVVTNL